MFDGLILLFIFALNRENTLSCTRSERGKGETTAYSFLF